VARLGRSGLPVACLVGQVLVVGSSRSELLRGVRRVRYDPRGVGHTEIRPSGRNPAANPQTSGNPHPLDSGLIFHFDPARVAVPRNGSLGLRRLVELVHGIGCRWVEGSVALRQGSLRLEVKTTLEKVKPPGDARSSRPVVVEPGWLECLRSTDVAAVV